MKFIGEKLLNGAQRRLKAPKWGSIAVCLCSVLIIVTLIAILPHTNDSDENKYFDPKSHYANEIVNTVAIKLRDEMQLYTSATGGGCVYNIHILGLSCSYYKELDIEQARELLVNAGILFLKTANENIKARPYLSNYPFELKNIELRFFIKNKDGPEFGPDKLSVVSLLEGKLEYDLFPDMKEFIRIHEETFAEAAEKLNIVLTPKTGLAL